MLREKRYIFLRANFIADMTLGAAAFLAAHFIRNYLLSAYIAPNFFFPSDFKDYLGLFIILPPLSVFLLYKNRAYDINSILSPAENLKKVAWSSLQVAIIFIIGIYLFKKDDPISRGQIILTPFFQILFLSVKSYIMRAALSAKARDKANLETVIIVGSGESLKNGISLLEAHPIWKYNVIGIISDDPETLPSGAKSVNAKTLATLDNALPCLENNPVDHVIIIPSAKKLSEYEPLLEGAEIMGKRIHLLLDFYKWNIAHPSLNYLNRAPMISYTPVKEMGVELFLKHFADRIIALSFLIIASPLLLIIMLLIKLTSGADEPVFFIQNRAGLNGKTFALYKFRTMRVGADRELDSLRKLNEADGPVFKIKDDPRITRLGKFLRKFSLDELPQFYNVLRGEMSLVGPRPPLPDEVQKYDRWQRRRLSMKPGLTCLWQVMGRNKLDFNTWMKLDLEYIDNWSLWLDAKILFRTIFVVITGYGAM